MPAETDLLRAIYTASKGEQVEISGDDVQRTSGFSASTVAGAAERLQDQGLIIAVIDQDGGPPGQLLVCRLTDRGQEFVRRSFPAR